MLSLPLQIVDAYPIEVDHLIVLINPPLQTSCRDPDSTAGVCDCGCRLIHVVKNDHSATQIDDGPGISEWLYDGGSDFK
jgi:hypothetical protein